MVKGDNSWLEQIRHKMNMTHEEVAIGAKITRHYYTMIANGRRPSVEVAKRIAEVLGFDWTLFYEQKGNNALPQETPTKKVSV